MTLQILDDLYATAAMRLFKFLSTDDERERFLAALSEKRYRTKVCDTANDETTIEVSSSSLVSLVRVAYAIASQIALTLNFEEEFTGEELTYRENWLNSSYKFAIHEREFPEEDFCHLERDELLEFAREAKLGDLPESFLYRDLVDLLEDKIVLVFDELPAIEGVNAGKGTKIFDKATVIILDREEKTVREDDLSLDNEDFDTMLESVRCHVEKVVEYRVHYHSTHYSYRLNSVAGRYAFTICVKP